MEEFGVTSDYTSDENAAHYYRQDAAQYAARRRHGLARLEQHRLRRPVRAGALQPPPLRAAFRADRQARPRQTGRARGQAVRRAAGAHRLRRAARARTRRIALVVPSFLENQYPFTAPEDPLSIVDSLRQAYVAAREADFRSSSCAKRTACSGSPRTCASWRAARQQAARCTGGPQPTRSRWPRGSSTRARRAGLAEGRPALPGSEREAAHSAHVARAARARRGGRHRVPVVLRRGAQEPARPVVARPGRDLRREEEAALRPRQPHRGRRVTLEFERDFGSIAAGEAVEFAVAGTENSRAFLPVEADGAEVVARDGRGRPALLESAPARGGSCCARIRWSTWRRRPWA